jgi:hypothetical protein
VFRAISWQGRRGAALASEAVALNPRFVRLLLFKLKIWFRMFRGQPLGIIPVGRRVSPYIKTSGNGLGYIRISRSELIPKDYRMAKISRGARMTAAKKRAAKSPGGKGKIKDRPAGKNIMKT